MQASAEQPGIQARLDLRLGVRAEVDLIAVDQERALVFVVARLLALRERVFPEEYHPTDRPGVTRVCELPPRAASSSARHDLPTRLMEEIPRSGTEL